MKESPVSTFALLAINVLVFIVLAVQLNDVMMTHHNDIVAILNAGGDLNPLTLGGEPWRILSSMFLHFGIVHLAANMYGLFVLGTSLEPAVGSLRFTLIYFICGITGAIASLIFNPLTISAGASGAIFGLYGYRLGTDVIGHFHDREQLKNVLLNFLIFAVINIYITLQINVDVAGHVGGCLAGLILSVVHFKFRKLISVSSIAVVAIVLPFAMFLLPRDYVDYYRLFQKVIQVEKKTDVLMKNVKQDAALLDSLKTVVYPAWVDAEQTLLGLNHVPFRLRSDTATLKEYVHLRSKENDYRIAMMERESYIYFDSLEIVHAALDSIPGLKYPLNFVPLEEDENETPPDKEPAGTRTQVYFDRQWREIDDPINASYFRIGFRDSIGRWQGFVRDYYRSGKIQMKGKYLDGLKNGVFIYYSERSTYESAGRYDKEQAVGKWENFHWNGALQDEVFYQNGAFTRTVWDSLGRAQVVEGEGKITTWYGNGQIREEGTMAKGRREGYWRGFQSDGKPYYEEYYRDNRLLRGISIVGRERYVYDQSSEFPFPIMGMPEYKKYLKENRKDVGSATGVVKVVFQVGQDGSTWDFVILQSLTTTCDQEAIRLVREGPRWRSAKLHGHLNIPSQGYVEVEF